MTGDRRLPRDLFPLPGVAQRHGRIGGPVCRAVAQRIRKAFHIEGDMNTVIDSLNNLWCGGAIPLNSASGAEKSLAQSLVTQHVRRSVLRLGAPPRGVSGPEALRALRVGGASEYSQGSGARVSFDMSSVSLPQDDSDPASLETLWGDGGRKEVDDFVAQQIRPRAEAQDSLVELGLRRCYVDPKLHDRRVWPAFVRRLLASKIVELTDQKPLETCGLFFVSKKTESSVWSLIAEGVIVISPSRSMFHCVLGLRFLELSWGLMVGCTQRSVMSAIASITWGLPVELRRYFGLMSVRAGDLGIDSFKGQAIWG